MKHYEAISEYNDVLYESTPVSVNDYLSDKYNIVHNELFNDALDKYIKSYVSKYVNGVLLYNIFKLFNTYSDYDEMYGTLLLDNNNYIINMINYYELNNDLVYDMFEKVKEYINNIKNNIINNVKVEHIDYVNGIAEIIKLTLGDISDFRISLENSVFLISENDVDYIQSEIDEDSFLFLLEEEQGIINIGFNENGEMLVKLKNKEYLYKDEDNAIIMKSILRNNNVSLLDEIMNLVVSYYKKCHRIIEIKNSEYWMPSDIIVFGNSIPYTKTKVSLKKYWNYYQKHDEYDISYLKLKKDNNLLDSEVTYIDYVNGKANMHAKTEALDYNVPFKYLNEDSKISDEITLKNTFTINL